MVLPPMKGMLKGNLKFSPPEVKLMAFESMKAGSSTTAFSTRSCVEYVLLKEVVSTRTERVEFGTSFWQYAP